MEKLSLIDCQLLSLIRFAIGAKLDSSLKDVDIDWDKLYELATEHSMVGICMSAIEKLPKEKIPYLDLLMEWVGQTEYIKDTKHKFDVAVSELATFLDNNSIDYVVFKGPAVASLYNKIGVGDNFADQRIMGDIDFYIPEWDFDKAVHLFEKSWNVKIEKEDIDKHFAFTYKDIRYEMHYLMETFGCNKHQRYFSSLVDKSIKDRTTSSFVCNGRNIKILPPMLDMMLVMKHHINHFIGEGVGLRQTLDFVVQLIAYKDIVNCETLVKHLKDIGYYNAFCTLAVLADKYFGVDIDFLDIDKTKFSDYADKMMAVILKNGNFGRMDYKYKFGIKKRIETAVRFFSHCSSFIWLAPLDILCLIPKRMFISCKAHCDK